MGAVFQLSDRVQRDVAMRRAAMGWPIEEQPDAPADMKAGWVDPSAPAPTLRGPAALPGRALKPPLDMVWARDMSPRLFAGGTMVKGLLDAGAMSVIYGPSNAGKSFFALDLAYHIATGQDWRGHRIASPGFVLYLAAEGGKGFINRVEVIKRHFGLPADADIPLAVVTCPIDLLDPAADVQRVIDLVKLGEASAGEKCVMVVGDTLSRLMIGGDENTPKDMTALVANTDMIRSATGAHFMLIHHPGKDVARGARGHSSLRAATDTEIELTRIGEGDDKTAIATVRKQRDMPGDDVFSFTLKSVLLGHDEDGDVVTSAVVEHLDEGGTIGPRRPSRLPRSEAMALQFLTDAIVASGEALPAGEGFPTGNLLRCVAEDRWRTECDTRRLSAAEAVESRSRAFRRAFNSLVFKQRVAARGGLVWITHPERA